MKKLLFVAALAVIGFAFAAQAHAQTAPPTQYPLLDFQHRFSVGARVYRDFNENAGLAGSYTSSYWAGVPAAYIITGRLTKDGAINPVPISLIGALDVGLQGPDQKRIRGYVGVVFLFKGTE